MVTEAEKEAAPAGFATVPTKGKGLEKYEYRMQVSPYDCTGCGSCVNVCPAKEKALTMKPLESQVKESANWNYGVDEVEIKKDAITSSSPAHVQAVVKHLTSSWLRSSSVKECT